MTLSTTKDSSTSVGAFSARSRKRTNKNISSSVDNFIQSATKYLEKDDDECVTLAEGYATKMRKLTGEQLMFADRLINEVLLDAQMGVVKRNSFVTHPRPSSPSTVLQNSQATSSHFSGQSLIENFNSNNDADDDNVILEYIDDSGSQNY